MIIKNKMYICVDCRAVFDEYDVSRWTEHVGEFWGDSAYEDRSGCPYCGGDYVEAEMCEKCEEYFAEDELEYGLCEECRKSEEAECQT